MKTTLIQVNPDDDLISVKDKIQWNPSSRILLVIPRTNHAVQNTLDLRRVVQTGRKLGARVAISTSQKALRRLAEEQGVTVFSSVIAAQKNEWVEKSPTFQLKHRLSKKSLSEKSKPFHVRIAEEKNTLQRILFFSMGAIAPIILILVLLPQATVRVFPNAQAQTVNLELVAKEIETGPSNQGVIPATIQTITLEAEDNIPTSGRTTIAVGFAKGLLRITNLTDHTISIPAKLRICTNSSMTVQFQTIQGALLEGGTDQFVDIPIEAIEPGSKGNVSEFLIQSVEGDLSQSIHVENPAPTRGGTDVGVNAVAKVDVESLEARLEDKLKSPYPSLDSSKENIYLTESIQILTKKITLSSDLGEPADQLKMNIKEEISVLAVKSAEIEKAIKTMAMIAIPVGYQGVAESLQFSLPTRWDYDPATQSAKATIKIHQAYRMNFDRDKMRAELTGKSIQRATTIVNKSFQSNQSAQIAIKPTFWLWMPLIPARIEVDVP